MKFTQKIYAAVLFLFICTVTLYAGNKHNILIINTYDNTIPWAKELSDSISNKLLGQKNIAITLCNLNANQEYNIPFMEQSLIQVLNRMQTEPDIIVTIGDEARMIYNRIKASRSLSRPVIATGVTVPSSDNLEIYYPLSVQENIDMMQKMVPDLSEIIWVANKTLRNATARKELEAYLSLNNYAISVIPIINDKTSGDAIYKYILENNPGRAILADSWIPDSKYSSFTALKLDSLLSGSNLSPIFTTTPEISYNNYIIGGYHLSARICAEKTVAQINKLLNGIPASEIHSEVVKNGHYILNKQAIKRYDLSKAANSFYDVKYTNVPPSLIEKLNGKLLLILSLSLCCLILLIYCIATGISNKIKHKKNQYLADSNEKKKMLVQKANISFAIYDNDGMIKTSTIHSNTFPVDTFFPKKLFEAEFLTAGNIADIKKKKSVKHDFDNGYQILIKPVSDEKNKSYKYIAIYYVRKNILNIKNEMIDSTDDLLDFIFDKTTLAFACYNIQTGEGYATDKWFTNIGEQRRSDGLIRPPYTNYAIEDRVAISEFMQKLQAGEMATFSRDIKLTGKYEKQETWIRNQIIVYDVDTIKGITVVDLNFNISTDKTKEAELKSLIKETEIHSQQINKFMNAISHEIRTPLTSIVGFSKMLASPATKEEKIEIVHIIKRNNEQLINLINNILLLSNINSGNYKFNKVKIDLNEFFTDLKIATEHMLNSENVLNDKSIQIILKIPKNPHFITTDEWSFRQVMINLLSNAVKFTDKGSITLGYQIQNQEVYFYVKDTGSGIASENHSKIFNPFEKIDSFTHGCGLGLALCKSIVLNIGGKIDVISGIGEGSVFWFTLPNK